MDGKNSTPPTASLFYPTDPSTVIKAPMAQTNRKKLKRNMIGLTTFAEVVLHISYKPGFQFSVVGGMFQIEWVTRDSRFPHDTANLTAKYAIPPDMSAGWRLQPMLNFIGACITQLETHEMSEWLKYNGKHVTPPHPGFPYPGFS